MYVCMRDADAYMYVLVYILPTCVVVYNSVIRHIYTSVCNGYVWAFIGSFACLSYFLSVCNPLYI